MDNSAMSNQKNSPSNAQSPVVCAEFSVGRKCAAIRPQGSGDWLIIATLAGAGQYTDANGTTHPLLPNELLLYRPDNFQSYQTDQKEGHWHMRWVHFQAQANWQKWLRDHAWTEGPLHQSLSEPHAAQFHNAFDRMLCTQRLAACSHMELSINALEEALIHAYNARQQDSTTTLDSRVDKAVRYIATHMAEPFQMESLARHCGLSPSRLTHLFTQETGLSPSQYSTQTRMRSAQQLLQQTQMPISEIAYELGYHDPLYFSRRYKLEFGHAPTLERIGEVSQN